MLYMKSLCMLRGWIRYERLLFVYSIRQLPAVVNGKVGISLTGLTTPIGWLSLLQLQLTVLSLSAIVVKSKFWWLFCVVTLLFGIFCGYRGFCYMNEPVLFLVSLLWRIVLYEESLLVYVHQMHGRRGTRTI